MVHVDFTLDENLEKELQHIDRNLVNRATVRTLRQIAKPVLNDMQDVVPVDTHGLQMGLGLSSEVNKKRQIAVVYAGLSKKNHPGWLVTRGLAMEYGNERVAARHFLSRVARHKRKPVYRKFRAFMDRHLDKLLA